MSENDVENVPMFDTGIIEKENIKLFVLELLKEIVFWKLSLHFVS